MLQLTELIYRKQIELVLVIMDTTMTQPIWTVYNVIIHALFVQDQPKMIAHSVITLWPILENKILTQIVYAWMDITPF